MGRTLSFRQKLGGAFALLLSLIILHGIVAWLALQEYNNLFGDLRVVNQIVETTLRAHLNEKNYVLREDRHSAIIVQEELQQAQTLVNAPSSSRTLLLKFLAIYLRASSSCIKSLSVASFFIISNLVSKSGGVSSIINPISNLEQSAAVSVGISLGSLSEVITICLPLLYKLSKVYCKFSIVLIFDSIN